jgi:hypothetical protein
VDDELLQFATEKQSLYLRTYKDCGSYEKAAKLLGVDPSTVRKSVASLKKKAISRGHSPQHDMTHIVPDGYSVKGVSTLYGDDGKPKCQWVKSSKDKTQLTLDALRYAVCEITSDVSGLYKPSTLSSDCNDDLLCVYPIADAHMGMYAWREETGEDWDSDLCAETLYNAMSSLVSQAPPAKTALIANLADFFHCDSNSKQTSRSGHILDVDTRWARVFRIGQRCYRQMIELALTKHEHVIVKSAIGNHDDNTGVALAMMMEAYFENEPRVTVDVPINPFAYYRFGETLLGLNHNVKAAMLPSIMAADQREEWGKTRFHHWLGGHIHHQTFHEFAGCTTETFRSPSPKDNWTHSSGYRADRDMVMIKYHREKGCVGRIIEPIY